MNDSTIVIIIHLLISPTNSHIGYCWNNCSIYDVKIGIAAP